MSNNINNLRHRTNTFSNTIINSSSSSSSSHLDNNNNNNNNPSVVSFQSPNNPITWSLPYLLSTVWLILSSWFCYFHLKLHVIWLRFLRILTIPWFYPHEPYFHHIIISGDDNAFGIGDWCTPGDKIGISQRLIHELRSHKLLRHTWRTINLGQSNTTSYDWLPSTSLFRNVFIRGSSIQRHSDVVILMIGYIDAWNGISGKDTANNIRTIAEILANEYAYVFVCTIPNWLISLDLPNSNIMNETNTCNALLRIWLNEQLPTSNILLGVEMDRTNIEYRLSRLYYYDQKHFSPKGYDKLSKDIALEIVKPLRRVEFNEEQKHIH